MTPRIRQYADEVAFWHGVGIRDILAKGRGPANVAAARADVMRRLRGRGYSLCQIGRWMGRDHTTVLHHVRSAANG